MKLKPFFCYYGGKWRVAPYYPKPCHDKIIEPFAGAAGYSVRYPDKEVELYEVSPVIHGVWSFLIRSNPEDILSLPVEVYNVDDLTVCQEAKWLIGFWLGKGQSPRKTPSAWMRQGRHLTSFWGVDIRQRIAKQVPHIKHWKVYLNSCFNIENQRATWFVDPPYDNEKGRYYQHRFTDYAKLAEWSKSRSGQVIVCENSGATWLPFRDFRTIKSLEGGGKVGRSVEVIWTND